MPKTNVIALDVGGKRVGVALGDTEVKIPQPLPTLMNDENINDKIFHLVRDHDISVVVLGYPRNQSGVATRQTEYVELFAESLKKDLQCKIVFQDESLTSVRAEEILELRGSRYSRSDVDAEAAAIILGDFLEGRHG